MLLFKTNLYVAKKVMLNKFLKYRKHLGDSVIDIGCGKQPFKKYFKDYVGLDHKNYADIIGDVGELPFKDECTDTVICSEVLEHVWNPFAAMHEISRILKKDGMLYLTVPMYWYMHYEPNDYWRFTFYSINNMLMSNKFRLFLVDRTGGLNYFIANRIGETLCYCVEKIVGRKIAIILIAPMQLLLYAYSKLDKFNKRDIAGWIFLARKL